MLDVVLLEELIKGLVVLTNASEEDKLALFVDVLVLLLKVYVLELLPAVPELQVDLVEGRLDTDRLELLDVILELEVEVEPIDGCIPHVVGFERPLDIQKLPEEIFL
ncbi:MAG: hypothetical protein M1836_000023 [Candelina mexicana]|nr:MAG: hypothetical protein M1836_000023 [Candelina mexicana]